MNSELFRPLLRATTGAAFGIVVLASSAASAETVRAAINNAAPTGGDPPAGLCHEVLTAIGTRYGWDLEFTPIAGLNGILEAVTGSTADVGCSGIAPTNERRNMGLAFTSPIFTNSEFLYVHADDATGYTSLGELTGKKVAGQEGSTFLRALEAAGFSNVQTYPDNTAGFEALKAGEIDAYVTGVQSRYQTDVTKTLTGIRAVATYVPVAVNPASLVVRNTDTALLGQLQAGLEALKAEGTLNPLVEKWGLPAPQF